MSMERLQADDYFGSRDANKLTVRTYRKYRVVRVVIVMDKLVVLHISRMYCLKDKLGNYGGYTVW